MRPPEQRAAAIHPALRTASLAREFYRMRGGVVRLRIGTPIPYCVLERYAGAEPATAYLRARTFFLANRLERPPAQSGAPPVTRPRAVPPPGPAHLLSAEVEALPADREVASNREFAVYLARPRQIPRLLVEIGRCRELAFRQAGEGSGESVDIDSFDAHYDHLLLWSKKDARVAGGYRLAVTTDVLRTHGASGLSTSTLFRFDRRFFEELGPAAELGRSFIVPEYQRGYSALLLLWRGILRAIARRREVKSLFGAVSISREYHDASRRLMASYLTEHVSHALGRWVRPRSPLASGSARNDGARRLATASVSLKYLKAGGRLLELNVDRRFCDVLDALIVVDLTAERTGLVERCMDSR